MDEARQSEANLALSPRLRREVQQRLALAEFDPLFFDGVFGPATRDALAAWQRAAGLAETGYLDQQSLSLLRERTDSAYGKLLARDARQPQPDPLTVLMSPVPPESPLRVDGCQRTPSGQIAYGQGVRCDFRGLRQNLVKLFG